MNDSFATRGNSLIFNSEDALGTTHIEKQTLCRLAGKYIGPVSLDIIIIARGSNYCCLPHSGERVGANEKKIVIKINVPTVCSRGREKAQIVKRARERERGGGRESRECHFHGTLSIRSPPDCIMKKISACICMNALN